MTAPPPSSPPNICSREEIEYERWRAERWMKTRHMPAVIAHDP